MVQRPSCGTGGCGVHTCRYVVIRWQILASGSSTWAAGTVEDDGLTAADVGTLIPELCSTAMAIEEDPRAGARARLR